jgi:hypothetical protein
MRYLLFYLYFWFAYDIFSGLLLATYFILKKFYPVLEDDQAPNLQQIAPIRSDEPEVDIQRFLIQKGTTSYAKLMTTIRSDLVKLKTTNS